MWQFLLFIAVTWFLGYLFGFFNGRTYGANEVLERFVKKKKTTAIAVAEVVKEWRDMTQLEKDEAWERADDGLKAFYWNNMTPEEQRSRGDIDETDRYRRGLLS